MKALRLVFVFVAFSFFWGSVNAMSAGEIKAASAAIGVATGVGVYALMGRGSDMAAPVSVLSAVGSGLISRWFLNKFTPEGRLSRAVCKINAVEIDDLLYKPGVDPISFARKYYISSNWPLVLATNHLDFQREELLSARSLLYAALNENISKYDFFEKCKLYLDKADLLLKKVIDFIDIIKKDSAYNVEFDRYQKDKLAKEMMAQQERIHNDDWWQRERFHREKMQKPETSQTNVLITTILS